VKILLPLLIIISCVWAGMLLGISFLEAPLKFQAPQVTLSIGLGIGRLVFKALNKAEIIFCLWIVAICFIIKPSGYIWILAGTLAIILLIQTVWLLPVLDQRAIAIINGETPKGSSPHLYYVTGEVVKVICLIGLSWVCLRKMLF
jgi:hypothetical protein